MTQTLITGGTGFLGGHLVARLLKTEKTRLRVLSRGGRKALEDALGPAGAGWPSVPDISADEVEVVEGSLLDPLALEKALDGCHRVYHLAGRVSRSPGAASEMMRLHVDGTTALLTAAVRAGVKRVLVVTTSGTVGVSKDPAFVADDSTPYPMELVRPWPYYLSKVYQEQVAFDFAHRGALEIVVVRPSLILGPGDVRGSSTGDLQQFLKRELPGVPRGGISFVDVRDVASALITAMDRGRNSSSYLLTAVNWTLAEFFRQVGELSGVEPPALSIPSPLADAGAYLLRGIHSVLGWESPLSPISLEMSSCFWSVDAAKAKAELDFAPRSPDETLLSTIAWLRWWQQAKKDHAHP